VKKKKKKKEDIKHELPVLPVMPMPNPILCSILSQNPKIWHGRLADLGLA